MSLCAHRGNIVTETNYRVYVHSPTPLQARTAVGPCACSLATGCTHCSRRIAPSARARMRSTLHVACARARAHHVHVHVRASVRASVRVSASVCASWVDVRVPIARGAERAAGNRVPTAELDSSSNHAGLDQALSPTHPPTRSPTHTHARTRTRARTHVHAHPRTPRIPSLTRTHSDVSAYVRECVCACIVSAEHDTLKAQQTQCMPTCSHHIMCNVRIQDANVQCPALHRAHPRCNVLILRARCNAWPALRASIGPP